MAYDSTERTKKHIKEVQELIYQIVMELRERYFSHDAIKLQEPEKSMRDKYDPLIQSTEQRFGYGSPEYEAVVNEMKSTVLDYHFKNSRHHPEFFTNGINGMTLVDIVEMLADWKAASLRSGQPLNLEANRKRFHIDDQLYEILQNTVSELGW